jgi:AbrB family looped-hinge helix DNA binding protein
MMREYVTTVTQRGQVTIPAEVRRLLNAKPHSKIAFRVEDSTVRLMPVEFTLEQALGSVAPRRQPEDLEELSGIAKEEKVQRSLQELDES